MVAPLVLLPASFHVSLSVASLLFSQGYYSSQIDWHRIHVDGLDFVLNIQLALLLPFVGTWLWLPFVCGIPRYLSWTSALLPLGSSTPSSVTTFLFLNTIQPHLTSLDDIPMSLLHFLVRWISESMSHSFLAYSLMSSMQRR